MAQLDLAGRPGRLLVDGKVHVEGKSADPIAALQMLPPAMAARGKRLAAGQIVITGSLIGMNWLTGQHDLEGVIDGLGEVKIACTPRRLRRCRRSPLLSREFSGPKFSN